MAANIVKYISNVTKSIGYSAIDTVKEMNPAISSFAEDNAELTKTLYAGIKDFKGTKAKLASKMAQEAA
jgi:hypothetical protein